jgi:hypothetical protein
MSKTHKVLASMNLQLSGETHIIIGKKTKKNKISGSD